MFVEYFGDCKDENLKENFIPIYQVCTSLYHIMQQLMDEMIDNGYPNITETVVLREVVMPPSLLNQAMQTVGVTMGVTEVCICTVYISMYCIYCACILLLLLSRHCLAPHWAAYRGVSLELSTAVMKSSSTSSRR